MADPAAPLTPAFVDRLLATVIVSALAMASGLIAATGLAAAVAFPMMRDLDPALPGYEAVGDHWMIAAGSVMAPIFTIAVTAAGVLIAAAGFAWAGQTVRGGVSVRALLARGLVILFALGVTGYTQFILLPRMNNSFDAYLEAARAGDTDVAACLRDNFDADHPAASRSLSAIVILSLLAAGAQVWAPAPRRRRDGEAAS